MEWRACVLLLIGAANLGLKLHALLLKRSAYNRIITGFSMLQKSETAGAAAAAAAAFREATELQPQLLEARLGLAAALCLRSDFHAAIAQLRAVTSRRYKERSEALLCKRARVLLAAALAETDELSEALELCEQALEEEDSGCGSDQRRRYEGAFLRVRQWMLTALQDSLLRCLEVSRLRSSVQSL